MLEGQNILVFDVETLHSAEECALCWQPRARCTQDGHAYHAIGWEDKQTLSLSIGCYYDYNDSRCYWFDGKTLEATIRYWVERAPLLVGFNSIAFDGPLLRACLMQTADILAASAHMDYRIHARVMRNLADDFEAQCARSYDILSQIWQADPTRQFERGLNSLDALVRANDLGAKLGSGAEAPRWWAEGRYAEVMNYCQNDVYLVKSLFETVCEGKGIFRGDGQRLYLPKPTFL